jgi:hypothetical protein
MGTRGWRKLRVAQRHQPAAAAADATGPRSTATWVPSVASTTIGDFGREGFGGLGVRGVGRGGGGAGEGRWASCQARRAGRPRCRGGQPTCAPHWPPRADAVARSPPEVKAATHPPRWRSRAEPPRPWSPPEAPVVPMAERARTRPPRRGRRPPPRGGTPQPGTHGPTVADDAVAGEDGQDMEWAGADKKKRGQP